MPLTVEVKSLGEILEMKNVMYAVFCCVAVMACDAGQQTKPEAADSADVNVVPSDSVSATDTATSSGSTLVVDGSASTVVAASATPSVSAAVSASAVAAPAAATPTKK